MNVAIRNILVCLLLLIVMACMIALSTTGNKQPAIPESSPMHIAAVIVVALGTVTLLLTSKNIRH